MANTTENTNCSDLIWVNLTCQASDANPPVESYQLLKNGEILVTSNNGTWIRKVSEAGKRVYSCRALHILGNVTSPDNVTITFKGGSSLRDYLFKNVNYIVSTGKNASFLTLTNNEILSLLFIQYLLLSYVNESGCISYFISLSSDFHCIQFQLRYLFLQVVVKFSWKVVLCLFIAMHQHILNQLSLGQK